MDFRDRNSNTSPSYLSCLVFCFFFVTCVVFPLSGTTSGCRQRQRGERRLCYGTITRTLEVRDRSVRPEVLLFAQKETHREMGKKRGTDGGRLCVPWLLNDDATMGCEIRMTMMIMNGFGGWRWFVVGRRITLAFFFIEENRSLTARPSAPHPLRHRLVVGHHRCSRTAWQ